MHSRQCGTAFDVPDPGEAALHIIQTNLAGVEGNDSYLLVV